MKTLKSALTGVALLFICVAANATVKPVNDKPTKTDVINLYIDAVAHGKVNNLDSYLDTDLQYEIQRGDNVNTLGKDQLMESLKNSTASNVSVTTTTTILADDDDSSTVKVEFKYDDYVRTDVVTLAKSNGWEITKITTSSK